MAVYAKTTAACAVLPLGPTGAQVTVETKDAVGTECSIFWSLQLGLVALLQVVWSDVGKLFKWNQ